MPLHIQNSPRKSQPFFLTLYLRHLELSMKWPWTVPHELSPEYRLQVCETLDNVVAFFADDERALQLIHLKGKDFSASEIQRKLGMSKTEYDTVTKRIRRRIANISVE